MKTNLEAIQLAKLEYISDIEWTYSYEDQFKAIDFCKDENGNNHVEQFLHNHKGAWFPVCPTDEELQLMYKILNDTPYREVEETEVEPISDMYNEFGVKRENFY